jgi:hypothetical protein
MKIKKNNNKIIKITISKTHWHRMKPRADKKKNLKKNHQKNHWRPTLRKANWSQPGRPLRRIRKRKRRRRLMSFLNLHMIWTMISIWKTSKSGRPSLLSRTESMKSSRTRTGRRRLLKSGTKPLRWNNSWKSKIITK